MMELLSDLEELFSSCVVFGVNFPIVPTSKADILQFVSDTASIFAPNILLSWNIWLDWWSTWIEILALDLYVNVN